MSEEDIQSGDRWNEQIAKALDATNFGIICVTKTNQSASWLLFEAGALAKSLEYGRVVPVCYDFPPSDLKGPLAAFQGRRLNKAGIERLVQDVSRASDKPMPKERLDALFAAMWPTLEADIAEAIKQTTAVEPAKLDGEPQRTAEDMLAEVVDRVRRLERDGTTATWPERDASGRPMPTFPSPAPPPTPERERLEALKYLLDSNTLDPYEHDRVTSHIRAMAGLNPHP